MHYNITEPFLITIQEGNVHDLNEPWAVVLEDADVLAVQLVVATPEEVSALASEEAELELPVLALLEETAGATDDAGIEGPSWSFLY